MRHKLAFIGLGVMGYPMAGHLAKAGHDVTVYNRTAAKALQWVAKYGGSYAETPAAASQDADFVMVCVGNDDDLRQVTLGATGILASMQAEAVLIDHTTVSAHIARELDRACREKGCGFLDAPVSGGQSGAQNGTLTIMVGGEAATYSRAQPIIDCYATRTRLLGSAGCGQLTKMVNQICVAGLVQALAEGLHFAKSSGLDPAAVIDVISKGAAQSWQMENRYETMLENDYDHGFAVKWMRKDLAIVLDEARHNGSSLPITALVDQFYAEVESLGGERWDTSSLLARLETMKK